MKHKLALIVLLSFLLAACVPVPASMPAYVVMLTNRLPGTTSRCTGAAIDPTHVLTAAHCIGAVSRIIAPNGQEALITDVQIAEHDMALVELNQALHLGDFAELGQPQRGVLGQVYGTCPYYWGHMPRQVTYGGMLSLEVDKGLFLDFDMWSTVGDTDAVCGGDSGGVVIQNGNVVGVISAVDSWYFFVAYGQTFFTVPMGIAAQFER